MADMLRPDGKPFVTDNRNAIPRYVVEADEDGTALVRNQFSGEYEIIGARPYSKEALRAAFLMLRKREAKTDDGNV